MTQTRQPRASARMTTPKAAVDLPLPSPVFTRTSERGRGRRLNVVFSVGRGDRASRCFVLTKTSAFRGGGGSPAHAARTALPPRACSFDVGQATWLVPRRGITVAGQHRNRTGFAAATPAGNMCPARRAYYAVRRSGA